MTKLTLKEVQELPLVEHDNILAKAMLRTGAFAEKYFPPQKKDGRDPKVISYVTENFDNSTSPLFNDIGAAAIWAAVSGVKFNPTDYFLTVGTTLWPGRGVCIVLVDGINPRYVWSEEVKKEPLIVTQEGSTSDRTWFRNVKGEKITLPPAFINTQMVRPATVDEMKSLIVGNLGIRPYEFIRNLGDALEGVK
jgi:hypothetical protein